MSKKKPAGFSPYFTKDDADQVRAAFLEAGAEEGYRSVTDMMETVTMREVKRLQRKYNQGKAFDPAPPGTLRPGRRTLEEEKNRGH